MGIVYNGSMAYLSITVDHIQDVDIFEQAGAEEFIFALKESCFTSAKLFTKEDLIHLKQRENEEEKNGYFNESLIFSI